MKLDRAMRTLLLLWTGGVACIGAAIGLAFAGRIPFIGLMLAFRAPDLLLLGACLLVAGGLWIFTARWIVIIPLTLVAGVFLGLNTRVPAAWRDLGTEWFTMSLSGERLAAHTGAPITVRSTAPSISARKVTYASGRPACHGDGCFVTRGFRMPIPGYVDYWSEEPGAVARQIGFIDAKVAEAAPLLSVTTTQERDLLVVNLQLQDASGAAVAAATAKYRSAFPGEPADRWVDHPLDPRQTDFFLDFLLHGNLVNRRVGAWVAPTVERPVQRFLGDAVTLSAPPQPTPAVVPMELVRQERFDPPLVLSGDASTAFRYDKLRDERCRTLIRPESAGPAMDVWWLFVNDPTGRNKIRHIANGVCDPDAVWSVDYVAMRGHAVLTKFDIQGHMLYRIPLPRQGSEEWVRMPSLGAKDNTIEFDWVTGRQSGHEFHIMAVRTVRLPEPR